jgi:hypothetical protein
MVPIDAALGKMWMLSADRQTIRLALPPLESGVCVPQGENHGERTAETGRPSIVKDPEKYLQKQIGKAR